MDSERYFSNLIKSVSFDIVCQKCKEVFSQEMEFSEVDYTAEKTSDMTTFVDYSYECEKCGKYICITGMSDIAQKTIIFDDIDDENIFITGSEEMYNDDEFIHLLPEENLEYNLEEIEKLIELADENPQLKDTLYRFAFIGCYSAIEGYLKEKLIYIVSFYDKGSDVLLTNFSFSDEKKYTLKEFMSVNLETKLRKYIEDMIFHKFYTVENMYNMVLNSNIDIKTFLMTNIQLRHDLVHRNNRNDVGEEIIIKKTLLIDLLAIINKIKDDIQEKWEIIEKEIFQENQFPNITDIDNI